MWIFCGPQGVGGVPHIERQLAALPKEIEKLKDDILKASSPEQKARLEANLQQAEAYLTELKTLKPTLPMRTVATTATLNEQGRKMQLLTMGRGVSIRLRRGGERVLA